MIYFDHNATTPMSTIAIDSMTKLCKSHNAFNASSVHFAGRNARVLLDKARQSILYNLDADDDYHLIFTSGATEANNLVHNVDLPRVCSAIEHGSVLKTNPQYVVPVNREGIVDIDALEKTLNALNTKCLVSIQYANNETGVIQDIRSISELCRKYGAIFHSDITQAVGKIPCSVAELGCDAVSISAHKFGGGYGAGALIARKGIDIKPLMFGGGQELRYRPGTQNLPGAVCMSVAMERVASNLERYQEVAKLRDVIENELTSFCEDAIVFSKNAKRLPNTLCIGMPNVKNEVQVIYFDMNGFAVSAGAACSSGVLGLPHVQLSMGYDEEVANTSIRVSLGAQNTEEEVMKFIKCWKKLYNEQNGK